MWTLVSCQEDFTGKEDLFSSFWHCSFYCPCFYGSRNQTKCASLIAVPTHEQIVRVPAAFSSSFPRGCKHSLNHHRTTGSFFNPLNPKFGAHCGRSLANCISGKRCTIRKIAACPSKR